MSAIILMAENLREELKARGIEIDSLACIHVVRSMIDHASALADRTAERQQAEVQTSP